MLEKVKNNLVKLTNYLKALDKKKRNIYFLVFILCVSLSLLTVALLNHKNYVVLYRNLDETECYSIAGRLDELSIEYKIEDDDTIYVTSKDEPKVKIQLASEGYPKSALNYDIFTDNIDFMTSDYEKTQYSLFQLQERLQASIKTLQNVEDAIVTITVPENSLSVLDEDKEEPTASAIISLKNGVELNENQINGVELLIARSVPGLTESNVSIVDQTGKVLNPGKDGTVAATTDRVRTENEISDIISERITKVLEPVYGRDNISIAVNVVLDYSSKTTERSEYIPSGDKNTGVISGYDSTYEGAGSGSSGGGVPGMDTNAEVPGYNTQTGSSDSGSTSTSTSVDYVVSLLKEQIQKQGAEIKDLTVSILIDKQNMTTQEENKITSIVANASGISAEKVALYGTEFTSANKNEKPDTSGSTGEQPSPYSELLSLKFLIIYAAVLVVLIAVIVILSVKRHSRHKAPNTKAGKKSRSEEEQEAALDVVKITESKDQQIAREIRDFSSKAPQITASLIRTLLKGDFE